MAHMARCLSALDGRPGADRSRGTGSTRSRGRTVDSTALVITLLIVLLVVIDRVVRR
jgi:hypothetical protein